MAAQADAKPTLLLVEDHPGVRLILTAGLRAQGFDVLAAATGEKALAMCRGLEKAIDLLVTDIGLTPPECWGQQASRDDAVTDGIGLAQAALSLRPGLKVVLLTGYSAERLQVLGPALQQFRVLPKPCDLQIMVRTFREMLTVPGPQ